MNSKLDQGFVERQRQRLEALKDQFSVLHRDIETEEQELEADYTGSSAHDAGEESAYKSQHEVEGMRQDQDQLRLGRIERALQKIQEGTYGLSDASNEPIPQERLEAIPEAIYTVLEEEQREAGGLT